MSNKPRVDSDAVLANVDIVEIVSKYLQLTKRGRDYVGVCPFHDDTRDSLEVSEVKQIYKCFACGAGGDAIDFLTRRGASFHDAIKELKGEDITTGGDFEKREAKPKKATVVWTQIKPVPLEAYEPAPDFNHFRHGPPAYIWRWNNENGELVGYTVRFDTPTGKEVLPYIYATDGTKTAWRWQGFEAPRPMFNAYELAANPDKTVVIFEGEKTAEAGAALLPSAVCVTWLGGSNGVHLTDWSPLAGRKVVYWRDNDPQGSSAMLHINELTNGATALSKWVKNPDGAPKHWDIADATDWSPADAKKYILANAFAMPEPVAEVPDGLNAEPVKVWFSSEFETPYYFGFFKDRTGTAWRFLKAPETVASPEPEPMPQPDDDAQYMFLQPEHDQPPVDFNTATQDQDDVDNPFRFLGFNKSESGGLAFYFYVIRPKTVVRLTASGISKTATLCQLAPLDYWEHKFPGKQGANINAAVNWLIDASMMKGPYKDQLIRGRGAWLDAGRVVLHAGDHLIVDGAPVRLGSLDTKYIYEWGSELELNTANPLKSGESREIIELLNLLNWEREINSYLLAGWLVLAPVCGALTWRPHIWLTGAAGTGKSWVFTNIVRRLLGETALAVQGDATEAGVRQTLGTDALPVVFDEAEGENQRAQARMQTVLGLMRSASSSDGGIITKGTGNGVAKTYRIRSCFAFASIAVQLVQQSDRSRVTVLGLRKPTADATKREKDWKELQAKYVSTVTDEYVSRLQARTIRLLPIITENARVFSAAAAAELGEQRSGDQIGSLLAGAFSLTSDKVITYEKALEWIRTKDWDEEKSLDKTKDETACLSFLLEQVVRVETDVDRYLDRTVGELVEIAAGISSGEDWAGAMIPIHKAVERLKRFGIKIDADFLVISNTAGPIKDVLSKTQWAHNHNKILLRIDGARDKDSTKFGPGIKSRAVLIPLDLIR